MLSHKVLTRQDVGRAASYYEDSADDYYAKEGNSSEWQGAGAKTLKLKGAVDSEKFRQLLAGNTKLSNEATRSARSSTRLDSNQRIGIDFTFSAPKSLSMQALIGMDKNIITAHDKAVKRALKIAEKKAEARKKINGKSSVEKTKNLIIAKFRHETSRERDPQLHTHAIIMNLTQRSDGRWCALRNDEIIKMTRYLGAVYRSELALNLQKMGYNLRDEGKGFFELAHITQKQIDGFSKRSDQIEQLLEKRGLTRSSATAEQKQRATMQSRAPKVATARDEILKEWQATAKELGINFDHLSYSKESGKESGKGGNRESELTTNSINITLSKVAKLEAAKRAVKFAINHLSERESVIKERELLNIAIKHAMGAARFSDMRTELHRYIKSGSLIREEALYRPVNQAAISSSQDKSAKAWVDELTTQGRTKTEARKYVKEAIKQGRLIKSEVRYTTQKALDREKKILQIEHEGRNTIEPIMPSDIAKKQLAPTNLNSGQKQAALLMLTTTNRIVGIQGFAGTGKSHMLSTAKKMIEESGYNIKALAPYGSQVKALKTLGIEAKTLASFLRSKDKNIVSRSVIVIDEAGVIPTRLMEQTLKLIEKTNARAVLLGDIAQTKAIEAGKPFDQLQKVGMSTAQMQQIERQKQLLLKEAVELAAIGDTTASLKLISNITEIKNEEKRLQSIVTDYMTLPPADRDKTIIVSGTNIARRYINREVRAKLKSTGELDIKGAVFDTLTNKDTTGAEREYSKYYHIGDIISPEKDYPKIGLKQNELYEVIDNGSGSGNKLKVKSKNNRGSIEFSPMTHSILHIYQLENTELAIGDRVRITRNDPKLNLVNGDRLKVKDLQEGHILLTRVDEDSNSGKGSTNAINKNCDVKLLTNKPLHIDYAYATTVHSSQGLTSDRVLIDIDTKSLTTTKDIYYVAISRARKEARIYTNNTPELPKAISREKAKSAALDIAKADFTHEHARKERGYYH